MAEVKDITGDVVRIGFQFGTFTVCGKKETTTHIMWDCVCRCGRHRYFGGESVLIAKKQEALFPRSCGFCKLHPPVEEYKTRRRVFLVWENMKQRCFNKNTKAYKDYGGRGIIVCDTWNDNFEAFYNYVSKLEHFNEPGRSLDRINNEGNYCPGNVRWATIKEQANNRRKRKRGCL